jgi:hypothetical protein
MSRRILGDIIFRFQFLERVGRACRTGETGISAAHSGFTLRVCFDETSFITFQRGDITPSQGIWCMRPKRSDALSFRAMDSCRNQLLLFAGSRNFSGPSTEV